MAADFSVRSVLLDVEGTTSSIAFVYETLFPFARKHFPAYLAQHWGEPPLMQICEAVLQEANEISSLRSKQSEPEKAPASDDPLQGHASHFDQNAVIAAVHALMDSDAKATGLKQLQGMVWEAGFQSGELRAHIYEDVPPALAQWTQMGKEVRIYSSGSVAAQLLFFRHTIAGNLLPYLSGHFDTTIGPKRQASSYWAIAKRLDLVCSDILFASDVSAELDAAKEAGMQTCLMIRPGNPSQPKGHGHFELRSFGEMTLH